MRLHRRVRGCGGGGGEVSAVKQPFVWILEMQGRLNAGSQHSPMIVMDAPHNCGQQHCGAHTCALKAPAAEPNWAPGDQGTPCRIDRKRVELHAFGPSRQPGAHPPETSRQRPKRPVHAKRCVRDPARPQRHVFSLRRARLRNLPSPPRNAGRRGAPATTAAQTASWSAAGQSCASSCVTVRQAMLGRNVTLSACGLRARAPQTNRSEYRSGARRIRWRVARRWAAALPAP